MSVHAMKVVRRDEHLAHNGIISRLRHSIPMPLPITSFLQHMCIFKWNGFVLAIGPEHGKGLGLFNVEPIVGHFGEPLGMYQGLESIHEPTGSYTMKLPGFFVDANPMINPMWLNGIPIACNGAGVLAYVNEPSHYQIPNLALKYRKKGCVELLIGTNNLPGWTALNACYDADKRSIYHCHSTSRCLDLKDKLLKL